jgi:hypothetical protein
MVLIRNGFSADVILKAEHRDIFIKDREWSHRPENFKRRKIHKIKRKEPLSYRSYIKSKRWRDRRNRYFKTHPRRCAVCRSPHVSLHHSSYKHLRNEPDEDLIPLCNTHHKGFHEQHGVKRDMKEETTGYVQVAAFDEEAYRLLNSF